MSVGATGNRAAESDSVVERLLRNVENFCIDGGTVAYPFLDRLARENLWSREFAERVIDEYKRFAFLAKTSGHIVVPSVAVDKAWHLHLIYTHSYWTRFCGEVLKMRLHHSPASQGVDEDAQHYRLYGQTLESYRQTFNEEPPKDIWPSADVRFAPKREVWLDVGQMFLLEKRFVIPMAAALTGIGWCLARLAYHL